MTDYEQGFNDKCAEFGLDGAEVMKQAQMGIIGMLSNKKTAPTLGPMSGIGAAGSVLQGLGAKATAPKGTAPGEAIPKGLDNKQLAGMKDNLSKQKSLDETTTGVGNFLGATSPGLRMLQGQNPFSKMK